MKGAQHEKDVEERSVPGAGDGAGDGDGDHGAGGLCARGASPDPQAGVGLPVLFQQSVRGGVRGNVDLQKLRPEIYKGDCVPGQRARGGSGLQLVLQRLYADLVA